MNNYLKCQNPVLIHDYNMRNISSPDFYAVKISSLDCALVMSQSGPAIMYIIYI